MVIIILYFLTPLVVFGVVGTINMDNWDWDTTQLHSLRNRLISNFSVVFFSISNYMIQRINCLKFKPAALFIDRRNNKKT